MKRSPIGITLTLSVAMAVLPATGASAATASFAYTGAEQTFVVPAGVSTLHVVAVGGAGAGSGKDAQEGLGGLGGLVAADVSVTPGQTLYVEVGGKGAVFNGGGTFAGYPSGGGASDIRTVPMSGAGSLASRRAVAGGGGGGGGGTIAGGDGGAAGQNGKTAGGGGGGGAGTATHGGSSMGGTAGTLGAGGTGGHQTDFAPGTGGESGGGGGGGGGYYGGGGGGAYANATGFAEGNSGDGGGGGGGSSLVPSGGSFRLTSAASSVTITYTLPGAAGTIGMPGSNLQSAFAAVSGLAFSNSTFAAESSGPSAKNARKKAPRGTKVSFALNEAASVRFTVTRRAKGRKVKRGKKTVCAKPTRKNRKRKRCTRVVTLKGSFTRNGVAGKNSFHFTGRLRGRKLKPGRYQLVATPTAAGIKGKGTSRSFRIVR